MKSIRAPDGKARIPAITSSRLCGFSSFMKLFIPGAHQLDTPSVRPVPRKISTFYRCSRSLAYPEAYRCFFHFHSILDNRQGAEFKVPFSSCLGVCHGKLRDNGTICAFVLEGYVFRYILLASQSPPHAWRYASEAPPDVCQIDQTMDIVLFLVSLAAGFIDAASMVMLSSCGSSWRSVPWAKAYQGHGPHHG